MRKILQITILVLLAFLSYQSLNASVYYWVGKSGNWNNAQNWSFYSGGNGGAGIPGQNDDVVFDNLSFISSKNTVTVPSNVQIHDFNWNVTQFKPTIISYVPVNFELSGSYLINGKFKNKITGQFTFNSSANSLIKTNGVHLNADIVKKSNNQLKLMDDIYLEGSKGITIEEGEFHLNSKNIRASYIDFSTNSPKKINADNSIVLLDYDYDHERSDVVYSENNAKLTFSNNRTVCGTLTIVASVVTNYNGQHVSCNGASDATVCVTITGGTGPFSTQWINGPNTLCWAGIDAGTYSVVVIDFGTGTVCNTTVSVVEPSPMTLFSISVTNPSCNGICDGSATPIIIGGTPSYSYLWGSGETTSTANNLCVGLNTLTATDLNGCNFDTTFFILTPTPMAANVSLTMVSCFGVCDGVAVSNPAGGNGAPFTFSWDGGPLNSVDSTTGLCAGNHTLHFEDNVGCGFDTSFTITQPIPINIQLTQTVNLLCNGICSGQLTVVASDGTSPYTYQWYNAVGDILLPGQTSDNATGLCAGTYYVIVEDANGCQQQSADFTITQPPPITFSPSAVDVTCFGLCDGILINTSGGGVPPYSYNWINASTGLSAGTGSPLNGVCPGTYFAEITDGNGCIVNATPLVVVDEPLPIQADVDSLDVSCFGVCDGGAIVASSSGGTGPLSFTWFNNVPAQIGAGIAIANQCAGSYSLTATDTNGCTLDVPFTINEPLDFTIDLTVTDASCNGTCNGTATINSITGQTGPYSIDWSTSANTTLVEINLCNGSFTVTITDANGCDTIHPFTINEPTTLTLTPAFADPTCFATCTGTASANPSGGTPPYTYSWLDGGGSALAQTTDTVIALCADTYSVTVTDANGCTATASYTLTDPPGMTATVSTVTSNCGVCDGSALVTIVGGNPSFSIQWIEATSGNPAGNSNPQGSLCTGNYYAIVTDSTGCSVLSDTVALTDNVIITGSAVATDPSCFGFCNGSIDLTFAGGTAPFTFVWLDGAGNPIGQSSEDASGLCDGDYSVVVTDSAGCSSAPITASLTEPTQLTATVTGQDATCNANCDGQATATPLGGTPAYSYTWTEVSTGTVLAQTTQTVTGLCAGDYNVIVTDAGGCIAGPLTVTINAPTAPTFTVATTDALCFGDCNGTAIATASGGTAPYTYSWSSSANTTDTEINLCTGTDSVTLTDANGCNVGPVSFTINEPTQLTATIADAALLCNGDCNASVSVTVSGGTTPYSYLWSDSQTTPVASGLCVGSYDVDITDANGCTLGPLTAIVTEPTAVTFTTASTDSDCNGNCNGTGTATPAGGTPPYSYLWTDPLNQTTQTAISLCGGTYSVTVTDANGCSPASQSVTINEPIVLSITITPTDVSCNSLCDGQANAVIAGGTLPYTILWDDPAAQTTANATGLCAGTYTVSVTDANGCTGSATVTINEPTAITATSSSTLATCNICDGSATITPSGGTGVYTYLWDAAALNQVTQTATTLCAGAYDVIVTDNSGCADTFTVAVSDLTGEILTMDSTGTSCFGVCDGTATVSFVCSDPVCTILWNDPAASTTNTVSGLCAGTYAVTVTNNTGCSTVETVEITEPAVLDANASPTNVLCNGDCTGTGVSTPTGGDGNYSYQWDATAGSQTTSTAFNLCAGTYDVTVTDGNGCTGTDNITVSEPTALTATVSAADASCNGVCDGTGTAFPSGGVGPYTYIWDDPAAQTTQVATGLCAGQYNVTVTDANGCSFGPIQITVNEPTAISVVMSNTSLSCNGDCDGTITATPSGGTSPYFYQWDDALSQTTQTATNLCAGTYTVIVSDVNGCTAAPETVTLGEPAAITSTFTVTDVVCNGNCDGQIQSNVNGGTLPYTYLWDDPAATTSSTVSNLCAGTFTLDITDGNGCTASLTATVAEPTAIQSNLVATDVSCGGVCDGSITTAASGGTGPYTYLWSPNGESTSAISNLCAGVYSVDITDAIGCTINDGTTITEPSLLTLTTSFAGSTCGQCDGSATVSPSGGQPAYSYQWDVAALNQTTQTALNLCAGVYTVIVTDAGGCSDTASVGVSDIGAEVVTISTTPETCFGDCDGTITAATACVDGPCFFQWYDGATGLPIAGETGLSMSNLCQGIYMIEVTNNSNCITIVSDTINQPAEILANPVVDGLDCNGDCDGQITLVPSGGTGGYTFAWQTGPTTATISSLCAGSYIVDVSDSSGCTITDTIDIQAPVALTFTTGQTEPSCNGDCDGTATVTVSGGISPYTYAWDDIGTQSTSTAVGLCAGTYNVIVTDDSLCTTTTSFTLTEPVALTATVTPTDATCNSDCDGTATATPAGGTAPYDYLWDDISVQTTQTATSLCAGSYNVIVGDANNCSVTMPVTINEPVLVTFTTVATDISCSGSCNGSIVITAAGGTGSYSYSIDNGNTFQASNTFSSLCAGSYDVVVIDSLGCSSVPQNTTINAPSQITATTSFFPADCNVANGAATIVPSGGTPGYTYVWMDAALNPIGQTTATAINLAAAIYIVDVTDANGCVAQFSVTVSNVNSPTLAGITTDVNCSGDCTGAIDVTTSGGNPPYVFNWVPDGQTTEDISNLCAGGYLIQVTDTAGCINFQNFTINEPNSLSASFSVNNSSCGLCDGSSTVTASGGTSPFNFIWSNGDVTATADSLCSGAYMVQITDASGCNNTFNVSVDDTGGPTETISQTNASCPGVCDGSAIVTPAGGTPPYSFYWIHDGSTTNSSDSLCAGTYFLEITDSLGCIRVTDITITEPQQLNDSTVVTAATCGLCDGQLSVFMIGGTIPYSFLWDAAALNATTSLVSNLCEGIYQVEVTDGNGCSDTLTYTISGNNAPQLTVTTTDNSCQGACDGTADVVMNGGTPLFTTTWLDGSGNPIGQSGTNATALCAGDYIVQVNDAAGCTAFEDFVISEPDSLLFSLPNTQEPSCFNTCDGQATAIIIEGTLPYTFLWNDPAAQTDANALNMCAGTFIVTVTDGNGCSTSQTVTIDAPAAITIALDSTDASCSTVNDGAVNATVGGGAGGYTYSWTGPNGYTAVTEDISNIFNGMYYLTVTDANGCQLSDSILVNAIIVVNAFAGNDTVICANTNLFDLTASGGVTYEWYDDSGNLIDTAQITQVAVPGTTFYVLIAYNGLCTDTDTINITVNPLPIANAGVDQEIIVLTTTTIGGSPTTSAGNTVIWQPSMYLNDSTAFNPLVTPDTTGTYTYVLNVTDPNGCQNSDTVVITVLPSIAFPNGFSPNGDGTNDVWEIDYIYLFPDCQVEVYNRWGQLLFLSIGYNTPWDGKYNNQDIPVGTYYYIINLNHPLYPDAYTGPLTVLR